LNRGDLAPKNLNDTGFFEVHEYTTDKGWNSTKNKGKSSYFFTICAGSGCVDFNGVSCGLGSRFMAQLRTSYFSCIRGGEGLCFEAVVISMCRRYLPMYYVRPLFFRLFDLWKEKHF
jgi:hypothetical protein